MNEATQRIHEIPGEEGFVRQFEEYSEYARSLFSRAWDEFVEMLIFPASGTDDVIQNTSEVSKYLNEATIISPAPFLNSVPNLLMGLGILGTFAGLAAGVGSANTGLSSGIPSEITASLEQLLSGASLAFSSSIVGIFLSILFLGIERNRSHSLQSKLYRWVDELEKHLRLVTVPEIAIEQLNQAKLTTEQLVSFNTELVFSIEKALEDKIAGPLVPQLERVVQSIEGLRSDRATDASHLIEQSLNQFTATMREQTGSQFEKMASVVGHLNKSLDDAREGFTKNQEDLRNMMDSVMSNFKTSLDANTTSIIDTLNQSLDGISDTVTNASKQMSEEMVNASGEMANQLRTTIHGLTEDLASTCMNAISQITESMIGLDKSATALNQSTQKSEHVLTSMTNFVGKLNTLSNIISSSHQQITQFSAQLERTAADVQLSSQRAAETLGSIRNVVNQMDTTIYRLEENQKSTTEAWNQYQARFENVDTSLAKVFDQIDNGLSRYCFQIEKFSGTLDNATSNAIKNLTGAISEFSEAIEELAPFLLAQAKSDE
ncbi:MAG: hypothetical protein OXE59_04390 [Bacteroidetes bacterium]|nr:hypothetical protein [Bacteroidota bacterium]